MCIRDRSKYEYKDTLTMKQDAGGHYVESRLKSGKDNPTPGTYEKHYVTIQNPVSYTHLDVYKRQVVFTSIVL